MRPTDLTQRSRSQAPYENCLFCQNRKLPPKGHGVTALMMHGGCYIAMQDGRATYCEYKI